MAPDHLQFPQSPAQPDRRPAASERALQSVAVRERLRSLTEEIVANVFLVEVELLRLPTRGRAKVALARQVAMYIAHVGHGLSLTEVGEVFDRDRTTVAHACGVVEQRREIREFDEAIVLIENIIRTVNGPGISGFGHETAAWPAMLATG